MDQERQPGAGTLAQLQTLFGRPAKAPLSRVSSEPLISDERRISKDDIHVRRRASRKGEKIAQNQLLLPDAIAVLKLRSDLGVNLRVDFDSIDLIGGVPPIFRSRSQAERRKTPPPKLGSRTVSCGSRIAHQTRKSATWESVSKGSQRFRVRRQAGVW